MKQPKANKKNQQASQENAGLTGFGGANTAQPTGNIPEAITGDNTPAAGDLGKAGNAKASAAPAENTPNAPTETPSADAATIEGAAPAAAAAPAEGDAKPGAEAAAGDDAASAGPEAENNSLKGKAKSESKKGKEKSNTPEEKTSMYVVTKNFRDAPQYRSSHTSPKEYSVDDNVSHFDAARLKDLVKRGFVAEQIQE